MSNHSTEDRSFRWLPKHGEPKRILEFISQAIVKITAFLPLYVTVVVTITLLFVLFGVPFVGR